MSARLAQNVIHSAVRFRRLVATMENKMLLVVQFYVNFDILISSKTSSSRRGNLEVLSDVIFLSNAWAVYMVSTEMNPSTPSHHNHSGIKNNLNAPFNPCCNHE